MINMMNFMKKDVKTAKTKTNTALLAAKYTEIMKMFDMRSEEHTSELQSHSDLVCSLLLEKKKDC